MKLHSRSFIMMLFVLQTFTQAWPQAYPTGRFVRFNGSDQYLKIPHHKDFNIERSEGFTLTIRIRPENFNRTYTLFSKGNQHTTGSAWEGYTLGTETQSNVALFTRINEDKTISLPPFATLQAGRWIHLAWVYNPASRSLRAYLNGQLAASMVDKAIGMEEIANQFDLLIGCTPNETAPTGMSQYWPGQVDELRIWKRALIEEEIESDMSADLPNTKLLLAAYDFENISLYTVPDVSGNGHHASLMGYGYRVVKPILPVGKGAKNERLTSFRIMAGNTGETVKRITFNLSGTEDLSDLSVIKIYYNGRRERLNLYDAVLFGTAQPALGTISVYGMAELKPGDNYFWIVADVHPKATEGHKIEANVIGYTDGNDDLFKLPAATGNRTILLGHHLLFSGDDWGSDNYRIPALVTARDGSLVTVTDKRWNNPFDLPEHIDLVVRRSTNKGLTWSPPLTIAGEGTNVGYGDAALVVNRRNGQILCLYAGDRGFMTSTANFPIRIYLTRSNDNGISWSNPEDITSQIYGATCQNPLTQNWQGAFVSSGTALQLSNGRIMAALVVRETTSSSEISNYVMYSDDYGLTWTVSPNRAAPDGNEAKIVERSNGDLLMSIRHKGKRLFNVSTDQGLSWGTPFEQPEITDPSCNGSMIRYTSIREGFTRNRILHSIPLATYRGNVSVLLSYDEGVSWPVVKTICPANSAYSSLTILPDGSIGMYYEVGEYETYQMYFARFSLDWLSDGADNYTPNLYNIISSNDPVSGESASLLVYPNPATEYLHLKGSFEPGTTVSIVDAAGRALINIPVEKKCEQLSLPVAGFAPGLYIVRHGGQGVRFVVR